jgi:hypothetical protein
MQISLASLQRKGELSIPPRGNRISISAFWAEEGKNAGNIWK